MYKSLFESNSNFITSLKSYQQTLISRILLYFHFIVHNHPIISPFLISHSGCYEYIALKGKYLHSNRVKILKNVALQGAASLVVTIFKVKINRYDI